MFTTMYYFRSCVLKSQHRCVAWYIVCQSHNSLLETFNQSPIFLWLYFYICSLLFLYSLLEFGSYKLLKLKHGYDVLRSRDGKQGKGVDPNGIRPEVIQACAAAEARGFHDASNICSFALSLSLARSRSLCLLLLKRLHDLSTY